MKTGKTPMDDFPVLEVIPLLRKALKPIIPLVLPWGLVHIGVAMVFKLSFLTPK